MSVIKVVLIIVTILWFLLSGFLFVVGLHWSKNAKDKVKFWEKNRGVFCITCGAITLLFGIGGFQFLFF